MLKRNLLLILICLIPFGFTLTSDTGFIDNLKEKLLNYNKQFPEEKIYLSTDKTYYQKGETIWLNSFIVNSNTHKPSTISDVVYVELIAPNGQTEKKLTLFNDKGTAPGHFDLTDEQPGGIYTLKAYTLWGKNFEEGNSFTKKITVQNVYTPRLLLKLDFTRESYGPGSSVEAELFAKDLKNNNLDHATIDYTVKIDGNNYLQNQIIAYAAEKTSIHFSLPDTLKSSDVFLQVLVKHKGTEESISRSVPITLDNISLNFFPEGGQMIAGFPSKLGFKALDEYNKGRDVEGVIYDHEGREITLFKSTHMGMGSIAFNPTEGHTYYALLEKPYKSKSKIPLPKVIEIGFGIHLVQQTKTEIAFNIHSPKKGMVRIVGHMHGEFIYGKELEIEKGITTHNINTESFLRGIGVFTLFDSRGLEQGERLVFINEHKGLNFEIKTDKEKYLPKEEVKIKITTRDEDGNPIQAKLALSVVDEQLLTLADDKQDNLLSSLLLSSEVKGEIEEPFYYFDSKEENRLADLDNLLLTQGWRRFTWAEIQNPKKIITQLPEKLNQISGTTFDKNGHPISTEVIFLEMEGKKRIVKVTSREDGRFIIKNVDPRLSAKLLIRKNFTINLDEQTLESRYGSYRTSANTQSRDVYTTVYTEDIAFDSDESGENASSNLNISLNPDVTELSEIVITGYGYMEKNNMTSSIAVVQSDNTISSNPTIPLEGLLQGRAVGVTVSEHSLSPGANYNIRIRGNSSLTHGQNPLYVVDGNPINYSINPNFSNGTLFSSEKISSVQVLNSSEGVALYGFAAANGVILITTKDGLQKNTYNNHPARYKTTLLIKKRFSTTREFYSAPSGNSKKTERTNFKTTLYWNPQIITNEKGIAEFSFFNNDAISSFRIVAEGISQHGKLGYKSVNYYTTMPLAADVRVPEFMGMEDLISIPVRITNETNKSQNTEVLLTLPEALILEGEPLRNLEVRAGESQTLWFQIKPNGIRGKFPLVIEIKSDRFHDKINKNIEVRNIGFPVFKSFTALSKDTTFNFSLHDPEKGSIHADFVAYPNMFSKLTDGLEAIFREPYGCFEQVSSSNYPNILALQLLKKTKDKKEVEARAMRYLTSGYKKLVAYEVTGGGFEWFGYSPAHEGLTAYGLLQFMELGKVSDMVDQKMMDRTYQWLLSRKDGKGGFQQNRGKYGFSGASSEVNNAYLV
ncbi:MAG: TonB-dependent receptor plug domain-containing protein, partial [Cyclobacteriaceae bacterium]|nr:TonB-dependent receptor plug domain-containing protein [Cyclobacteriaceae bacterium]